MKTCLITPEYPPETNWGGIATYTKTLAHTLSRLGHKATVISLAIGNDTECFDNEVKVYRLSQYPKNFFTKRFLKHPYYSHLPFLLWFRYKILKKVCEITKTEKIDIIEAPEFDAQAIFLSLKKRTDTAYITRLHTPRFLIRELNNIKPPPVLEKRDYSGEYILDYLEKKQTILSDGVSSPTKALAKIVEHKWNIKDIKTIPNFFDLEQYQPDESIYKTLFKNDEYLLFYGRLEVRKGVHILAKTLPRIFQEFPGIKMAFIGQDLKFESGFMGDYIKSVNSEFSNRLIFVDNIPHKQLYPVILRARLVILPSLWENFPYTCLEAMSLGKTVVATSGSGYEEIIEDGVSGYLVEPGNVQKLEQKIIELLKTNDPAIGRNAKVRVNSFSPKVVVSKMVEYYEKIIRDKRGSA